MFRYDLSDLLIKKLEKIKKKDKVLAGIFYKKVQEIIQRDATTIQAYKNLRAPLNEFKRIHLTDNYLLLFKVEKDHIIFVDIRHWDDLFG